MDFEETIRKCLSAYVNKDREAVEEVIAEDFTFASPDDPELDRAAYFEKCWPFNEQVKDFRIEKLIHDGNEGFMRYECETKAGRRFKNTEFFVTEGGKIKRVEVYYGVLIAE